MTIIIKQNSWNFSQSCHLARKLSPKVYLAQSEDDIVTNESIEQ